MPRILFIAAILLMAFLTQACTKPAESGPKTVRIGFAMMLDDPYWQNMKIGAEDEARKLGATVTILNGKEDVQVQAQQINDLIAQGVDVVCLVPTKPDAMVNSVRALNAAKIPVIIVNRQIGPGCDFVTFTGTDTYAGAITSAKILMDAIGGSGQIIEFQQVLGTGPQIARSKALEDTLKDYPNVKLVERIPHEGNDSKVVAAMATMLGKYPDLKGIYVHGDPQALAAANACIAAGRKGIKIVGMGGSQLAIDAIKAGILTGTSYQQPEEEGRSGIRLALQALKGEKLPTEHLIGCPPITKENADKFKGQF